MQSEAARLDLIVGAAAHLLRRNLIAVIAQSHSHTGGQRLDRERDRLIVAQIVSVTNHVRASFIDPEHHECSLLFRERMAGEKFSHEIQITNGQISSDRPSSVVGSSEGATIKTSRLNLDSSGAFQVASHIAEKSGTRFDSASYTLRNDQRGDPVWIVTLHAVNGQPVGTIHIGANRGTVTRTEGMFAGATMEDVQTEREVS